MADERVDHEGVAEEPPAREARDDLGDDAHGRQDHDVDGRMAVEPEQVLEEQRIAAVGGVEDRQAEDALAAISSSSAMASTGVASTMTRLTAYIDQTKSGRRNQCMPGARSVWS